MSWTLENKQHIPFTNEYSILNKLYILSNAWINQCINLKCSQRAKHQGDRYQYAVATCTLKRTYSAWSSDFATIIGNKV